MTTIHLGYELGTGKPIAIPLKHTMVSGITQEAGKTTTLEALITRSGLRALTFLTKRGEGAFGAGRTIAPYFREQADWRFVAAVLEASEGERLKFERAWIMRASKGARTLADVQRNVGRLMETAKGLNADVYFALSEYLAAVVPEIGKVKWAAKVDLAEGLNVMDLTALSTNIQHLVIKSSLDYVLNSETDTVVVVPEAWKFIPNARGTPVKLAAEAFIRQGAGLRNYLWLDSQDIAGVEPLILKSVPLWLLGVQRELNEVKRTLNYVPGAAKPKPATVAELGLGQFIACWGTHVHSVYVQPAWMDDNEARQVARGEREPRRAPVRAAKSEVAAVVWAPRDQLEQIAQKTETEGETEMTLDREYMDRTTKLLESITRLLENHALHHNGVAPADPVAARVAAETVPLDEDAQYQRFKARLMAEVPQLIRLLAHGTEIHVSHERKVVEVDTTTLRGQVLLLVADGFFDDWASGTAATKELARRGHRQTEPNVYRVLNALVKDGVVQAKERQGFKRVEGVLVVRQDK